MTRLVRHRRQHRTIALATIVASMAGGWLAARPAHAQSADVTVTPGWNAFSADMTIRRSHIPSDGSAPQPAGPATTYHWEQTLNGQRWSTVMTLGATEKPLVRSKGITRELEGTTPNFRIEDAGDGSPIAVFDQHGKPLQMPGALERQHLAELAAIGGWNGQSPLAAAGQTAKTRPSSSRRGTAEDVLIEQGGAAERRQALAGRFGRPQSKVGTLDRFLVDSDGRVVEVLVDPEYVVPVEMNIARQGTLQSHVTFEYAPAGTGQLIRRRIRTEHVVPNGRGSRMVTDVTFDNVRFERRAR